MNIFVEQEHIRIGDKSLEYYPYYFSIWDENVDYRVTVKNVLTQWASALTHLLKTGRHVYLPYYLDDQGSNALKASIEEDKVVLTSVLVAYDGWAFDLNDLSEFMTSEQRVIEDLKDIHGDIVRTTFEFGKYNLKEFIDALTGAEVIDA